MSFAIFSNLIIRLQSNLYADVSGMDPLLSASVDSESKVLKVKLLVDITWNDD